MLLSKIASLVVIRLQFMKIWLEIYEVAQVEVLGLTSYSLISLMCKDLHLYKKDIFYSGGFHCSYYIFAATSG